MLYKLYIYISTFFNDRLQLQRFIILSTITLKKIFSCTVIYNKILFPSHLVVQLSSTRVRRAAKIDRALDTY